jgi:hypothetical protein
MYCKEFLNRSGVVDFKASAKANLPFGWLSAKAFFYLAYEK